MLMQIFGFLNQDMARRDLFLFGFDTIDLEYLRSGSIDLPPRTWDSTHPQKWGLVGLVGPKPVSASAKLEEQSRGCYIT